MRRLITLVALAVALPVAACGVAGLFGCATPQGYEEEPDGYLEASSPSSKPKKAGGEFPIEVSKDEFAKTEIWTVSSEGLKDDEKPSSSRTLLITAVYDKNADLCALRVDGIFDTWMFIENAQIAVGDAEPARFEPITKDRDNGRYGVIETMLFDCDAVRHLTSGENQRVRIRVSGGKGRMTVTAPPGWIASVSRMLAKITPEQPPAPPAADEAATSPATPETPAEAPPAAAADER